MKVKPCRLPRPRYFAPSCGSTPLREAHVAIAATLVTPNDTSSCRTFVFAFPGGGYNRRYFDLRHPALAGDTQAEWHARHGMVFLTLYPYGGGDSTKLDPC